MDTSTGDEAWAKEDAAFKERFGLLNTMSTRKEHIHATLEGLRALYDETQHKGHARVACCCAMGMSMDYSNLRNWEHAEIWARRAYDMALGIEGLLASEAAKGLAIILRDKVQVSADASLHDIEEIQDLLESWAARDGAEQNIYGQVDKYGILGDFEMVKCQLLHSDSHEARRRSLAWLEKAKSASEMLPTEDQAEAVAEVHFKSSRAYYDTGDFLSASRSLEMAQMMFESAGKARQATRAQIQRGLYQSLYVEEAQLSGGLPNDEMETRLNDILDGFQQVQDSLTSLSMRRDLVRCHLMKAWAWERAYTRGQVDAVEYAMEELHLAEEIQNGIRSDMTIGKSEEILKHKASMAAQSSQIINLAVKLHLKTGECTKAWSWVQKGKARSFLDMLAFETTIPARIFEEVQSSPEGSAIVEEERRLLRECEAATPGSRVKLRQDIADVRRRMQSLPELQSLLLYRGMTNLTADFVPNLLGSNQRVACVDWTIVEGDIYLFVVRHDRQPASYELELTEEAVEAWIASNLKAEYMRQPRANERLRALDRLIDPLAASTYADELLILCPAGCLSALPLHALQLGSELLLERNPVVYTSSLSTLYHCTSRGDGNVFALQDAVVFGNPSEDREAAGASARAIAQRIGVKAHIGADASKAEFERCAQKASIVFYQGHATYDAADPMSSALMLSTAEGKLTAREILHLLLNVALVIMIACDSAQQEISVGEEPSGLLPIFMLSGVNSAIGTLWKCRDAVGQWFAEDFMDALLSNSNADSGKDGESTLVDTARAVQQATLSIRKRREEPYYWALFVLYGSWSFSLTRGGLHSVSSDKG